MFKETILCGALALTVINPVSAATNSATATDAVADTAITGKVKALYAQSPIVKMVTISVTTNNQDVILTGEVPTDTQYEEAVSLAKSVDGVNDVIVDNLTVKSSNAPLTDTYTTAKVKGTFMKEKLFGTESIEFWPVKVETKDGVVYLTGEVSTEEQKENAEKLAKTVSGVQSVNSAITVKK